MRTVHIGKIFKVGHSSAVVIPVFIAKQMGFLRGDRVEVVCVAPGQILIKTLKTTTP